MMENDQIKSQIENAKKAFIAGKERSREVISSELDTGNEKVQKDMVPEDRQLQEDIMSRVRGLMDEATQTRKGVTKDPFIARQPLPRAELSPSGHRTELIFLHLNNLESDKKCKTRKIPTKTAS